MQQANISKDVILLIDEFKTNKIADEDLESAEAKRLMGLGLFKH